MPHLVHYYLLCLVFAIGWHLQLHCIKSHFLKEEMKNAVLTFIEMIRDWWWCYYLLHRITECCRRKPNKHVVISSKHKFVYETQKLSCYSNVSVSYVLPYFMYATITDKYTKKKKNYFRNCAKRTSILIMWEMKVKDVHMATNQPQFGHQV